MSSYDKCNHHHFIQFLSTAFQILFMVLFYMGNWKKKYDHLNMYM